MFIRQIYTIIVISLQLDEEYFTAWHTIFYVDHIYVCARGSWAAARISGYYSNGVVTDSVTNEPLEYVNIYLKGSDKGCMTDEYGRFSISTDANFTSLQATLMGYDVKEIFVDKGRENMLRLQLSPTSVTLQEVTVNATKNKYSKKE